MGISNETVAQLIRNALPDAQITVSGDGHHYEAHVVSSAFTGLSSLKRQQLVYAAVSHAITSGQLHALAIRAFAPAETAA